MTGLAIAGLVALAPPDKSARVEEPRTTASVPPPGASETDSPWQPLLGAAPAFALSGAEWRDTTVSARRNVVTGVREDTLSAGPFEDGAPFLHLVVSRDARTSSGSLFLSIARRAAVAGLAVPRSGPPSPLATKFGAAEIAPVTLAASGVERACTALRLVRPESAFVIEGWLCGAPGQSPADANVACALDGLRLASGTGEGSLKAVFAGAEGQRSGACGGAERTVLAGARATKAERR